MKIYEWNFIEPTNNIKKQAHLIFVMYRKHQEERKNDAARLEEKAITAS